MSRSRSKQRNSIHKSVQVVRVIRYVLPIDSNHIMRPHCVLVVNSDRTAITLQTENPALANLAIALSRTISRIVVEERVQSCAVDGNAVRVNNAKAPAVRGRDGVPISVNSLLRELWIMKASNEWEWKRGARVWLVVGRLRLNL